MSRAYCNLGLAHLAIGNYETALECQKYFLGQFSKLDRFYKVNYHHCENGLNYLLLLSKIVLK